MDQITKYPVPLRFLSCNHGLYGLRDLDI